MNWIFSIFDKQITAWFITKQNTPIDLRELNYSFTDSLGKRYFSFAEKMALPEIRYGKLQEYLIWLSNGLTSDSLDRLIDVAEKALEDGIVKIEGNKRSNAVKIGAVLHEIRSRKDMIKPIELLFNIIAVQIVREDEDPKIFNQKIHTEKVEQFIKENDKGNYFFFRLAEFRRLFNSTTMSEIEWKEYCQESLRQAGVNERVLAFLMKSAVVN